MSRGNTTLNQQLAAAIQEIACGAIHAIVDVAKAPAAKTSSPDRSDEMGEAAMERALRSQEGVFPRRATVLGREDQDRYVKGKPVHDASGKFRRSDAKG